jgi:hypothetical protein
MTTRSQDANRQKLLQHDSLRAKKKRAKAKVRDAHVAKAKSERAKNVSHNEASRIDARSAYELEPGTRKSSRKTVNRAKTDSSIRKTVTTRATSSGARAQRRKEGGGR